MGDSGHCSQCCRYTCANRVLFWVMSVGGAIRRLETIYTGNNDCIGRSFSGSMNVMMRERYVSVCMSM